MSDVVRDWLEAQLGLLFEHPTWEDDRGGKILATLLYSFQLLTSDQFRIIFNESGDLYEQTLEVMRLVVENLGVELPKRTFHSILHGRVAATTKLFYELYLVLHDKDDMHFLIDKKVQDPCRQAGRFKVTIVDEEAQYKDIVVDKFKNPLGAPLESSKEVIKYHIDRYMNLLNKCKESRQTYLNFLKEKQMIQGEKVIKPVMGEKHPEKPQEVLLPDDVPAVQSAVKSPEIDPKISTKILKQIKNKARKAEEQREVRKQYQKQTLRNMWHKLLQEQEEHFKNEFTKQLRKQSLYEQKMTTCFLAIREQRSIMTHNKSLLDEMIYKEQEKGFMSKLIDQERKSQYERALYYIEQERKNCLHKKLYEEKLKRKERLTKETCSEIIKDIVDIALYQTEYQEDNENILPRRKRDDLARLFCKRQPIFDIIRNISQVIKIEDTNENPTENLQDDDLLNELDRQNDLDLLTFEDYHLYRWPWDYHCFPDGEDFDKDEEMTQGLNVLGYIVHRLLLEKYPKYPYPPDPQLEKTTVAACFTGLEKLNLLPALERLLSARSIKVIQIEEAYNYCLEVFKRESTEEYTDGVFVVETEKAALKIAKGKKTKGGSSKSSKKGSKGKTSKKSRKSKILEEAQLEEPTKLVDKINQTPKIYPDEEMVLSNAGQIGKYLFECLNLGESPNESLTSHALVEYLKSLKINPNGGWVLVNYPQTIQQAVALEEALNRMPVPFDWDEGDAQDHVHDMIDLEIRESPSEEKDANKLRSSKLVPNPKPSISDDYDTFLTAFIEMKPYNDENPESVYDCFKSPSNMSMLHKFYQDQGCKYTLYYKDLEFPTVKHLGKLILGDYSVPPKESLELFTDTVKYVEAQWGSLTAPTSTVVKEGGKMEKKKKTPKKVKRLEIKDDKKDKKSKKGKKNKSSKTSKSSKSSKKGKKKAKTPNEETVERDDKETQIPEIEPEPEEPIEPELPPSKPGDPRWIYVNLPINPFYSKALAELWENIERVYLTDMQQLFFRRRVLMDSAQPYNTFVRENLSKYVKRPDTKQEYLHQFQTLYNNFDEDMREDEEVKAEFHMRIEEFREKLWKICDYRMLENENERIRIIQDDWTVTMLVELLNVYVNFLQIEVDRSSDSQQFLADYYTSMVTEGPFKEPPLEKIQLELLRLPQNLEDLDHLAPFVDFIETSLMLVKTNHFVDNKDSPFHGKLSLLIQECQRKTTNDLNHCQKALDEMNKTLSPKKAKKEKKKKRANSKSSKGAPSTEITEGTTIQEPDRETKDRAQDLSEEFRAAFQGEHLRINLRLKVLEKVFNDDFMEVLSLSTTNFHALHREIEKRYRSEVEAVDQATQLLKRAVEEETKIQPEMMFQGDKFYVRLGVHLYENPLPEDDSVPIREPDNSELFTYHQLDRIAEVLLRVAPTGIIPERSFTFLLQDFLVHDANDGKPPYVPPLWTRMTPSMTHQLSKELFGETLYLDWKDFIIYNMNIEFPTENDIKDMRNQFIECDPDRQEFIYRHQLPQIKWWFENCDFDPMQLERMKNLLYKLFKVDGERMNYTSMLLVFCKDRNPILGLTKGLIVAMGKTVNVDARRGSLKYANCLKKIMQRELEDIVFKMEESKAASPFLFEQTEDEIFAENFNLNAPTATDTTLQEVSIGEECAVEDHSDTVSEIKEETFDEASFTNEGGLQGHSSVENIKFQVEFDTLMAVCTAMVPWLHRTKQCGKYTFHEYVALVYNNLINEDVQVAYFHQLLEDDKFTELIASIYKFHVKTPYKIVKELLRDKAV